MRLEITRVINGYLLHPAYDVRNGPRDYPSEMYVFNDFGALMYKLKELLDANQPALDKPQ